VDPYAQTFDEFTGETVDPNDGAHPLVVYQGLLGLSTRDHYLYDVDYDRIGNNPSGQWQWIPTPTDWDAYGNSHQDSWLPHADPQLFYGQDGSAPFMMG